MLEEVRLLLAEHVTIGTMCRLRRVSKTFSLAIDNDKTCQSYYVKFRSLDAAPQTPLWDVLQMAWDYDRCFECGKLTKTNYPDRVEDPDDEGVDFIENFTKDWSRSTMKCPFACCTACQKAGFRRVKKVSYSYWRLHVPYCVFISDTTKEYFFVNRDRACLGWKKDNDKKTWCEWPDININRQFYLYNDSTSPRTDVQLKAIKKLKRKIKANLVGYTKRNDFSWI